MAEREPILDPVSQIRAQYEEVLKRLERPLGTAEEELAKMNAAVPFFELGVKLGKMDSPEAKALADEIGRYIEERRKQLKEQVFPQSGLMSKRGG